MKKLFKVPVRYLWVLASIIILQACYPGGSIPLPDLDTTTTLYDTDDLATAPVSAGILWEVVHVVSDDGDDIVYDGKADDEILNTTLDELVKLYGENNVVIISESATLVPAMNTVYPNVRVVVPATDPVPDLETLYAPSVILRNKQVTVVYPGYPWYGGGWYGGWYPGFGGCYYCGYPTYGTVTYQVGSVILEMYDLRNLTPGQPAPPDYDVSWFAIMRGLLSSNPSSNSTRVISGIQQAFAQSPYLK